MMRWPVFSILNPLWMLAAGCDYGSAGTGADGCRGYPPPAESAYVLPYAVGVSYEVSQGNCGFTHRGQNRFAYDFRTKRGDQMLAMRSGVVKAVSDASDDGEVEYNPNYIEIEHDDGTIASYVHLKGNSIPHEVGAMIEKGAVIGQAGSVATHVVVKDRWNSIPITFQNAPQARYGLVTGKTYEAVGLAQP